MHRIRTALIALALAASPFALWAESNGGLESTPAPGPVTAPAAGGSATSTTSTAHAPDPPQVAGQQQQKPADQGPFGGMGFLLIMAVPLALMWFMATRSQKKEEKRKQELLSSVKRGDQVVTIGGAHGEVTAVGETTVDVRFGKGDDGAVITFNKSAIATVAGVDAAKAK